MRFPSHDQLSIIDPMFTRKSQEEKALVLMMQSLLMYMQLTSCKKTSTSHQQMRVPSIFTSRTQKEIMVCDTHITGNTEQKEKDLGRIGLLGAFTRPSLEHDLLKIIDFLITTTVLHLWSTTDDIFNKSVVYV